MTRHAPVHSRPERWRSSAHDRAPGPARHWRSYGDDPLPTGREALDEPFRAFPSWFMRITCDRCGKDRMVAETHAAQRAMLIRDIIAKMRHDGCGGGQGGGAAHRHRGRQQPAGAADRAAVQAEAAPEPPVPGRPLRHRYARRQGGGPLPGLAAVCGSLDHDTG